MIKKESVKKILIIKLRGIGDVVLSTIILDNLKTDFPDATIDYLTDPPSKPGLEGLKQINQVLVFPRNNLWERIKLFRTIRRNKYDLVFDFFTNPGTAQLTFLSGAKYRVGFPYRGRKYAYNLFGPEERGKYHSADLHLKTLQNLSLTNSNKNLYYYISNLDKHYVQKWLSSNTSSDKFLVGISPSGGWPSKKCDPEKFAEIASAISKKYKAEILILWGNSDKEDAITINNIMPSSMYAPPTTIREMAAFIQECKFIIANDSGPMHISTAVGTPVLSIHGPTDPRLQGPYGDKHEWINNSKLECIICNLLECPKNHECFKDLQLDSIMNKIDMLIQKNNLLS